MLATFRPVAVCPSPKSQVKLVMAKNGREAVASNAIGSCSSAMRSSPASATSGSSGTTTTRVEVASVRKPLLTRRPAVYTPGRWYWWVACGVNALVRSPKSQR